MFKVNNKDTRTTPTLTFITYFTSRSSVSIVNFEQVKASWVIDFCGKGKIYTLVRNVHISKTETGCVQVNRVISAQLLLTTSEKIFHFGEKQINSKHSN